VQLTRRKDTKHNKEHTHTHNHFTTLWNLSATTQVSQYQNITKKTKQN